MLVAGLLHDTVEDSDRVTLDGIKQEFGHHPARIVEGETKFSKLGQIHPDMTKEELQVSDLIMPVPLRLLNSPMVSESIQSRTGS